MDIALDEVIHFDAIASDDTGLALDADSTPTWAVYEEATDTPIQTGNFTKRTSLDGQYRGTVTLSAANGCEVGKWYNVSGFATIDAIATKAIVFGPFRVAAAEAVAGKPKVDADALAGQAIAAAAGVTFPASVASPTNITAAAGCAVSSIGNNVITAASIASNAFAAAKFATDFYTAAAAAIWNALTSGLSTANSIGKLLVDNINATIGSRAAPGDEMDLIDAPNETARHAFATTTEGHLLDEGDSQLLINAIVGAIGNTNVDQAVLVAAIRADLERSGGNLHTLLARIIGTLASGTHNPQTGDAYSVVNSGTHGNAALKTLIDARPDAAGIRTALGMTADDLDEQLDAILAAAAAATAPTAEQVAAAVDELLSDEHGAGSWESAGAGAGARTFTILVEDADEAPLEGAKIRMIKGAENYLVTSDADGESEVSRDDGTWQVAITLAGYTFTPTTLVVSAGTEGDTITYTLTALSLTPSDPGRTTGYLVCYDAAGAPAADVVILLRHRSAHGTGLGLDESVRSATSDANGLVQFDNLFLGGKYTVIRGAAVGALPGQRAFDVDIPADAGASYALPSVIGQP